MTYAGKKIFMRPDDLDSRLISFGPPSARAGSSQVYYAGVLIRNLYRIEENGAGAHTQRYYLAREIERRLLLMSNHERLELHAAVKREGGGKASSD
jgi:hypothetical protein